MQLRHAEHSEASVWTALEEKQKKKHDWPVMIIFKCTQNTQLGPKQHTEIKCPYNLRLALMLMTQQHDEVKTV